MKNLDTMQREKAEILQRINTAVKDGDEEAFSQAFTAFTDLLQEAVMSEAKGLVQAADNHVLAGRGARALTSKETEYYSELIGAMKASNPKQALADFNVVLPETVIDAVFEDIAESHPLLDVINFQPTGALVEILVSTMDGRQMAEWGKLCDEIIKELSAGFTTINLAQKKLSAFLPLCKAMLDLGPVWLDRYVRAHLSEAIYNGLEGAIIDGSGVDEPIGIRRNPSSALDPVTGYDPQPLVTRSLAEKAVASDYSESGGDRLMGWKGYGSYGSSALSIDFQVGGLDELLQKIEKAGNGIDEAVSDAVKEAAPVLLESQKAGAARHRKGSGKYGTDTVFDALESGHVSREGNYTYINVGIDLKKHPEAKHAVFEEYVTDTARSSRTHSSARQLTRTGARSKALCETS